MPKAGLEPACLAAPPPQDGVSANSTTSAVRTLYLLDFSCWPAGAGGLAGAAGAASFAGSVAAGGGGAGVFAVGVFFFGAGGGGGGVAGVCAGGVVVVGAGGVVAFTGTTERPPGVLETMVNAREVTMKMIADAAVAFARMVVAQLAHT